MRCSIGAVLNESDINGVLVKRWGIPPGVLRKSVEVVENVRDGSLQILGACKRLKGLGMRASLISVFVRFIRVRRGMSNWEALGQ
jgi:hypothetical protein